MSFCLRPSSSRVFFIGNYNKAGPPVDLLPEQLEQLRHGRPGWRFVISSFEVIKIRRAENLPIWKVESWEFRRFSTRHNLLLLIWKCWHKTHSWSLTNLLRKNSEVEPGHTSGSEVLTEDKKYLEDPDTEISWNWFLGKFSDFTEDCDCISKEHFYIIFGRVTSTFFSHFLFYFLLHPEN